MHEGEEMDRLFDTNVIRERKSLDGMWNLSIEEKGNFNAAVPGCWEQIPELSKYRGVGIYTKKITTSKSGNLRFVFKGISHTADIYFDEKKVAHHYNAYTPFSTVIKNAEEGEHELRVVVDNTFGEHSALHIPNDYYTYGGIVRPVIMESVPDCFIEYVHFTPELVKDKWCAEIEVKVSNVSDADFSGKIVCTLNENKVEMQINALANSCATSVAKAQFENVSEWSNETPTLYLLNTTLYKNDRAIDDLIERVGFRTIKIEEDKVYLNNKKIFFKGFNRHEDHPTFGCAIPLQLMAYDIQLMIDAGANAVRTSHYPNDERFLDLCDERGLLVWEENHARALSEDDMKNVNFDRQCEDCIREMIENHYNHPSIIIWGILNECASHTTVGREKYAEQFKQIGELDNSRPKSFATCQHYTDICLDLPDILSVNVYPLWYNDDDPAQMLDKLKSWMDETAGDKKPFIITEFGAGGIYGYRSETEVKWTEERQKQILDTVMEKYLNRDDLSGIFIWQFCDTRVNEEWSFNRPKTMNNKGIVDGYRRKKLAYETVKSHFGMNK